MKDLRDIPAPIHSAPPRRKSIANTGIRQTPLSLMPAMFFSNKKHLGNAVWESTLCCHGNRAKFS
jgi:hypothetical protein